MRPGESDLSFIQMISVSPTVVVKFENEYYYLEYKGPGDNLRPKQIDYAKALFLQKPEKHRYILVTARIV